MTPLEEDGMMWRRPLGTLAVIGLVAAGCSGDDGDSADSEGGGSITFWTVYDTADRIAIMEQVLADFTDQRAGPVAGHGLGRRGR
jgi:multiple sugar transport system substrate-binding protein